MKLLPKVLIIAAVPACFGIILMTTLAYLLSAQEAELKREKDARTAVADGMILTSAVTASAVSVFQYSALQTEASLKPYYAAKKKAADAIAELKLFMAARPKQLQTVTRIEQACQKSFKLSDEVIDLIAMGGINFAPMRLREVREIMNEKVLLNELDTEIAGLDEPFLKQSEISISQYRQMINNVLYGGSSLAIAFSFLVPFLLSRQVTNRLHVILENSERLARRAPLHDRMKGSDEIADLDKQFHEMSVQLNEIASQERAILENAGAVIFTLDSDGKITEIAKECEKVWGYSAEDLFGRRVFSIVEGNTVQDFRARLSGLDLHDSVTFEGAFVKSNGQIATMLINVRNGGEQRFYCVAHDITERKVLERQLFESESKVRTLVDKLPAGLLLTDPNGRVRFANQSAARLLSTSLLLPNGALPAMHPQNVDRVDASSPTPLLTNMFNLDSDVLSVAETQAGKSFLTELNRTDSSVPVELSLSLVDIAGAQFILSIFVDLTERLSIDRIKQELVRTMADDVAQPMRDIAQTLITLKAGDFGQLTDKAYGRLSVSISESERLLNLFDDFLRIRIGEDIFELTLAPVSVRKICERAVDVVSLKASQKDVSTSCSTSDTMLVVDENRVVQVLVNLLTNAIKFSPEHSTVAISEQKFDKHIELTITDSGPGIPEDALDSIFEPFKQVSITDATHKGGTGLGLTICKNIVEKHGGSIRAENGEAGGARFVVILPIKQ